MQLRVWNQCFLILIIFGPLVAIAEEQGGVSSNKTVLTRILFGSCIQQGRPTPIFPVMLQAQPQLLLFLGDNIYADTSDIDVMRAKYSELANNDGFKALMSVCPVMATWDDHDYGLNDGGASYPERDAAQQAFLDFWGEPADSLKTTAARDLRGQDVRTVGQTRSGDHAGHAILSISTKERSQATRWPLSTG